MQSAPAFDHAAYENATARTLSLQEPNVDEKPRPEYPDWPVIYDHCESRLNSLRSWRYSWWQHWAILAQYILPYRFHWVITSNTFNRGFPVNDSIINNTATLAMRICASGLFSGLMSPSRPWFMLDATLDKDKPRIDQQARVWMDDLRDSVLAVLAGSNWYGAGAQAFQDVATFGTAPMIIYEDEEDIIRVYVPCAGEYFLASGGRLTNDTLYREFTYTVLQIVDFFRLENCPEEVQNLWQHGGGGIDREFVVAHSIEPNFDLAQRGGRTNVKVVPGGFAYREVYWLRGRPSTRPLSIRGFHENPFGSLRWSATSNDPYGRGPGMDALGDGRQLQTEERRKGEYIDKLVRPPMVADVTLENKPSSILPGEITYVNAADGKQQFYPAYEVNAQGMQPLTEDIKEVEQRINRAFFTDVFLMITQMEGIQPRNEMELSQRIGEKIQQLGPVIELFEQEAAPMIQRVISIMYRRGLIAEPPPSLHGIPISITYTSMMKMAQRAGETAVMERTFATFGSLSEAAQAAQLPNPMRVLNLDECGRTYADRMMFPAKCLFTPAQVAANDKAVQQHMAEQQAMAATLPAVQAAQGLSKIPVGGGQSALDATLGTQGGPT